MRWITRTRDMSGSPRTPYQGRIGRYGPDLAAGFLRAIDVPDGARALDVGCGPGALTRELADRLGPRHVAAVDPAAEDVEDCRAAVPGADVRVAAAEALPFADAEFDVVLAQLVVSLLADADAGVAEMRRVARRGGTVAACSWDFGGAMTVVRAFWDAAVALDPSAAAHDQARKPYSDAGALAGLWERAGLTAVRTGSLIAAASYSDRDDLWEPLVAPDGPPGAYYRTLEEPARDALRREVWRRLGTGTRGPFRLTARAWYVTGHA